MSATGTMNNTAYYENGVQVWPCPCGETHRGPHAIYDYGHHVCHHSAPLLRLDDDNPDWLLCSQCGQSFTVERVVDPQEAKPK